MSQGLARARRAAFASCREHLPLGLDDRAVAQWLEKSGVAVQGIAWDDPDAQWDAFDVVIIRSPGSYQGRITEFRAWVDHLDAIGARVYNPAPVLRWNLDKHYLDDLAGRGVPVVPTTWFTRDRAINLAHTMAANGWRKAVVKPAVAGGGRSTWITDVSRADRDQRQLLQMLGDGDVMLQPFMPEVARDGEYSFVFFGRHFSHATIRRPRPGDYRTQAGHGGRSEPVMASAAAIEQAAAALAQAPGPLLYARVDGVLRDGDLVLMGLELVAPDLDLARDPSAAQRFASAIRMAANLS